MTMHIILIPLVSKAISHPGGYFCPYFIVLNGSPIQNRALKTSGNDGDFCYGHTLCTPDGAQLSSHMGCLVFVRA